MAINITDYPTNVTDITEFYIWGNNQVGGIMGIGFLVVFFLAMFFVMKGFEAKKAFAASAFGTAIIGIMMWGLGDLLATRFAVIAVLIAAFSLLWIIFVKD